MGRSAEVVRAGLPWLFLVLGLGSCKNDLPPIPQVVVYVDTDLPEELATRLRVDLFSDEGVWFASREFSRASARDWPASFGVVSPSLTNVVARARVAPEGHVRDDRGDGPRLFEEGVDRTPASEPSPDVTVDRFVLLTFEQDAQRSVFVTLRAACAGTAAELASRGRDLDLSSVSSCALEKGKRIPLAAPTDAPHDGSLVGSWASGGCGPDSSAARVCVPGGAFVFGNANLDPETTVFPPRERIARVDRFWIDRSEVTVAAYRAALGRGFTPPEPVRANDRPLTADPKDGCSFTTNPQDREALALTCVSWRTARAYCNFAGGDLPTEARWEYAATRAGKTTKTAFPWGDDEPTCDRAAFGRAYVPPAPGVCQGVGSGPLAAGRPTGDVTPLGIAGLGGGVSEWMQDAPFALDEPCWRDAPMENPACILDDARRSVRGGSWAGPPPLLQSAVRRAADATASVATLGFRCAYEAP